MTVALCLSCGATKWGALCPCEKCEISSCGDMEIDMTFSNHYFAEAILVQFGTVIKEIKFNCNDSQLCFWAFFHYLTVNNLSSVNIDLPPEAKEDIEELLAHCTFPD